jgi:hypothetical protein
VSNCVEIVRNADVIFTSEDLNISALKADILQYGHSESPPDPRECPVAFYCYWFLARNTDFSDDSVVIRFGEGRSSHTWRDLGGLVRFMGKYMKKTKKHTFIVTDEIDDFQSRERYSVAFEATE